MKGTDLENRWKQMATWCFKMGPGGQLQILKQSMDAHFQAENMNEKSIHIKLTFVHDSKNVKLTSEFWLLQLKKGKSLNF